jgi:hypothetical protein
MTVYEVQGQEIYICTEALQGRDSFKIFKW